MILESISTDFDPEKFYLGTLCSRGHDWDGTGRSLRYRSGGQCRDCVKENSSRWQKANPEKVREKSRRWAKASPEKVREKNRRWAKANPEKVRESRRRWAKANPEKVREKRRCWEKANPEKAREKLRHWRQSKPEAAKAANHRRRARKAAALVIPYTAAELAAHFAQFDGCAYCGAPEQTLDHLFPLSHDLLAADALFNIVPACSRCNCSKQASHPVQWYRAQPFYDPARLQRIIDALGIGEP